MRRRCLLALPFASALPLFGSARAANGEKAAVEEVAKQWGFTSATLQANGAVAVAGQSNGDKLRWEQLTAKFDDLAYADTFARVLKFYALKCGAESEFGFDPKKMVVGHKGEGKRGRFIFSDMRDKPRETSFVFDATEYTVSGLIRPGDEKDAVEVILTIAVR